MLAKKNLCILPIIILLAIKGFCQNRINGVVNTKDSIKLPFATVTLYADSFAIQSVVSDSDGYFKLLSTKPVQGHLLVRAFYKQLSSNFVAVPKNGDSIHIIINDPVKVLSAVTIEADVSRINRKGDRFIFVPARGLTKGSDAFEILRHVPMIKVEDQSDAFSIINKSSTVIYVNSKKTDIPKNLIVQLLRSMPADNIISIEVITNPGSEFASNITGGIININLRRGFSDGWQGSLTALTEQSKYNTSMFNGGVTYRKGKVAINLIPFINSSFNYYRLVNDLSDINNNTISFNTKYLRNYLVLGGGVNVDYQASPKSFFGFKYWQTNVSGNSNLATANQSIGPGKPDTTTNSFSNGHDKYLYNFGNFNYHYNFDSLGKNSLDLNIDFNRFTQDRTIDGSFDLVDDNGQLIKSLGGYRNILPQRFWNLSEELDLQKTLSNNSSILFGLQFSHTKVGNDLKYYDLQQSDYTINNELSEDYQYRESYQAAYVSLNQNIGKKLGTSAGLRMERTYYESSAKKIGLSYDSTYYNLYPSLSASYFASQKHQFGYSLSRKIIRPNIEDLYPGRIYRSNNYFTENNPFLQPTLLFVNELSYLLKRRYSFSITYSSTKNSNAKFVIPVIEDSITKFKETLLNYGSIQQLSIVFNTSFNFLKGKWQLYLTPYYNHVIYSGNVGLQHVHVTNNDFNIVADNYFQLSKSKNLVAFLTFNFNGPSKDISGERVNSLSSLAFQVRKTIKKFSISLIASDLYNGKSHTESNLYANYLLTGNHLDKYSYTRAIQFKIRYSFGNNNLKSTKNRNTANQDIRNRAN